MAAEVAIISILSNSAPLATALGGVTGTGAKVHMGILPVTELLPALSVIRTRTTASDTKSETSKLDEETVLVVIHALNYKSAYTLSPLIRTALDGIQNTNYVVGADTVQVEHIWFSNENNFLEENADKVIYIFEQEYLIRIKR
jgi:hypothetical protein